MWILVFFTILSFSMYLFYKIKGMRLRNRPNERRWVSSKASISLGMLMIFFAGNELYMHQTTGILIMSIIFFLVGGLYVVQSIRLYKALLPYAAEEAEKHRLNGGQ